MRWAMMLLALGLGGCRGQPRVDQALQRMREQPRYDPYERSGFFANGAAMQPPPEGTIARERVLDRRLATGRSSDGSLLAEVPVLVTADLLARGRSRFEIFCAACHGVGGYGGSVVAYNMVERRPPSLRQPELRSMPAGYFYNVIQSGLGRMPSYAAELPVADRWAVVAYLRQLQRSGPNSPEQRTDSVRAAWLHSQDSAAARTP